MAEDKPNAPLEGLVLGIVGVGGTDSLGFRLAQELIKKELAEQGIVGTKGINGTGEIGISKIYLYSSHDAAVNSLLNEHLRPSIEGVTKSEKDEAEHEKNEILYEQLDQTFFIEKTNDINVIAKNTDICIFTYEQMPLQKRKILTGDRRNKYYKENNKKLKSWKDAFKGYQGIILPVTNPTDYLAYSALQEYELEPDQIAGFNHVDTFRLRGEIKKELIKTLHDTGSTKQDKIAKIEAIKAFDFCPVFNWGDHSDNSFLNYGSGVYDAAGHSMNNDKILGDPKTKEGILKRVHSKGFELLEDVGTANANTVIPLVQTIEGIVRGKGIFEMSYYLEMIPSDLRVKIEEIEKELQEKWDKKYTLNVKGICTGVPVTFTRNGKKIRVKLADAYRKSEHEVSLAKLGDNAAKFHEVIVNNVTKLIESKVHEQTEGTAHFLDENVVPVVSSLNSNQIVVIDPDGMEPLVCKEASEYNPNVIYITTADNLVLALSKQQRQTLHFFELPFIKNIESYVKKKASKQIKEYSVDLGEWSPETAIIRVGMVGDFVYLVKDSEINKTGAKDAGKILTLGKYPFNIKSFIACKDWLYCGNTQGEIAMIDGNTLCLERKYSVPTKGAIVGMKLLELGAQKHILCTTSLDEICRLCLDTGEFDVILQTKNRCFDTAFEKYLDRKVADLLCLYSLDDNYDIKITPLAIKNKFFSVEERASLVKDFEQKRFKAPINTELQKKNEAKCIRIDKGNPEFNKKNNATYILSKHALIAIFNKGEVYNTIPLKIGPLKQLEFAKTKK